MFMMYKLDVCKTNAIPDGFIVEDCGEKYPELSGYSIICREHRISEVLDWAKETLGVKYPMFEKQFSVSKTKAMTFIRVKLGIKSFTSEFVNSCGSVEEFMKQYCSSDDQVSTTEKSDITVSENEASISELGDTIGTTTTTEQNDLHDDTGFEEELITEQKSEDSEDAANTTTECLQTEESEDITDVDNKDGESEVCVGESEALVEDSELIAEKPSTDEESDELQISHECPAGCIYDSSGEFKGFSEGQILNMLQHLKDLDDRICLDSLNPDDIMTDNELQQSMVYLDTVAPSVFKAFLMQEVESVKTESDKIRVSAMLNKFSGFLYQLSRRCC